MTTEPIVFKPLYMERVWGGRTLEAIYGRELPDENTPFGESWEMTDRREEQSIVDGGLYDGSTLNTLWKNHKEEIFGKGLPKSNRFPLLIKILDAQKDLSVQVHPTMDVADELGGGPKTEMWYIADAEPSAKLYVGVKEGVTKDVFQTAIEEGTVEDCIHTIKPKVGSSIHIESGRLHAIGAGLLIYEIQQNSDTTYRVYDWNRMGLDGKPRQLHIEESMMSIDFSDVEPEMGDAACSLISSCEHFQVHKFSASGSELLMQKNTDRFAIITVVDGELKSKNGLTFIAGDFFLLPLQASPLTCVGDVTYLETTIPSKGGF